MHVNKLPLFKRLRKKFTILELSALSIILAILVVLYYSQLTTLQDVFSRLTSDKARVDRELRISNEASQAAQKAYFELKNQDQYKINQQLKLDVDTIQHTYKGTISAYEKIQDLKAQKQKTEDLELQYIAIVKNLGELHYASAEAQLNDLNGKIKKINDDLAAAAAAAAAKAASAVSGGGPPAPENNTPPGSGYSYQAVKTEIGIYTVSIVAADLGSTRVIIDTASDSDCRDNCPVLSVGDYAARSSAFAAINGSYFCPASYPSCAGKTNSFDTLLMNKNKTYFNSDNNVYSTVPVAVFGSGYARFIGASSSWGRDTGVDGVIANQPLLLSGGTIAFSGGNDPKQGSKGARSFVGNKGSTVYIGVVYNATVAEVAYVLKALGLDNALNLDSGGSTALWVGGYKVGPGRNIPNAVLFVRR